MKLFLSNLKLGRWGIIAWGTLIFLYGILTMYIYPTMTDSSIDILGYINALPDAMKAAFGYEGIDFTNLTFTPEAFATLEFLVLWPLLIGVYGIFASISLAREAERGTLDLLLAQPIRRYRVLISKFAVFIFAALVIAVASLLGLLLGTVIINETVDTLSLALALVEALLLVFSFASFTLLSSVIFLEPRKSLLVAGVFVGGSYIINFIVPILNPSISWLRNISLFYHYQPNEIVNSASLNWTSVSVYTGVSIVCFLAALIIFQKRDLVT
jgi:ABC-2 type transport system permease protein